jgi:hypothetical protein
MFHLTLMGGSEVRLKEQDNIVITLMGGTEILMPTIAEKILYVRRMKREHGSKLELATRRTNVITLMGATVTKVPTLGQEIEELMQLRESGMMSNEELMKLWHEVLEKDDLDVIEHLTIMGGSGEESPDEKEEVAALERLIFIGFLSTDEVKELKEMIMNENFSTTKSGHVLEKIRGLLLPSPLYSVSSKRNTLPSHVTE